MSDGYSVNMRRDTRTGEYLAVIPCAYRANDGTTRYYLAIGESDGCWVELTPEYVTRCTRTVTDFPESLKRTMDRQLGYILNLAPRLSR